MRANVQKRHQAIALRKQGKSYREIQEKLAVSKGTLSKWLGTLPLTKREEQYLRGRTSVLQDNGRLKAAKMNQDRHESRRERIRTKAKVDFLRYKDDPFFVLGLGLYWSHGAKSGNYLNYVSAEPAQLRIMADWVCKFLPVEPVDQHYRWYGNSSIDMVKAERWWSRQCAIPRSQFLPGVCQVSNKGRIDIEKYHGSLRLTVSGSDYLITVMTWQNLLSAYYVATSY